MKLWLLEAIEDSGPWDKWYDKAFSFVVRANTEEEARALASGNCGDEYYASEGMAWKSPKYSTCTQLLAKGKAEVVIRNFAAA